MARTRLTDFVALPLALALILVATAGARAQQAEIDYLLDYVGNWQGSGTMTGGEQPEEFSCRMSIVEGRPGRINYTGRCSLLNLNLSVNGAIGYSADAGRYEAVMTSNTAFSGVAVGERSGNSIVFDLQERNTDQKGQDLSIGSQIVLRDNTVVVDFDVTFNESGETMHSSVPFQRVGG